MEISHVTRTPLLLLLFPAFSFELCPQSFFFCILAYCRIQQLGRGICQQQLVFYEFKHLRGKSQTAHKFLFILFLNKFLQNDYFAQIYWHKDVHLSSEVQFLCLLTIHPKNRKTLTLIWHESEDIKGILTDSKLRALSKI